MSILMTGNPNYGIAEAFSKRHTYADFMSRSNRYDLTTEEGQEALVSASLDYGVFINNSALNNFAQTTILSKVANRWRNVQKAGHIINIGSTIDTTTKGQNSIYQQEKKALLELSKQISLLSVWAEDVRFRNTHISFGSLKTPKVIEKFEDSRNLIDLITVINMIDWIMYSGPSVNLNLVSIDPIQKKIVD